MFRSRLPPALALTALVLAAGCATTADNPRPAEYAPDPGLLRVAVSPDSRPIIFKQGDKIVGLDAEIARKLGEELGREVVFIEMPFTDLIPAIEHNRADIILSNMSMTIARRTRVAFTKPYMPSGQMALIRRADMRGPYNTVTNVMLTDGTVGTEAGTTGELFVQSRFENAKKRSFDAPDAGARALRDGKIDVFVHDIPVVWRLAGDFEADGLTPLSQELTREFIAGAVALDNTELLAKVNAAFDKWSADGSLTALVRHWAPFL